MKKPLITLLSLLILGGCSSGPLLRNNSGVSKEKIRDALLECYNESRKIVKVTDKSAYGGQYLQESNTTWKKKKGDCDDITLLAYAILRGKGIEAEIDIGILKGKGHLWIRFPLMLNDKIVYCVFDPTLRHAVRENSPFNNYLSYKDLSFIGNYVNDTDIPLIGKYVKEIKDEIKGLERKTGLEYKVRN